MGWLAVSGCIDFAEEPIEGVEAYRSWQGTPDSYVEPNVGHGVLLNQFFALEEAKEGFQGSHASALCPGFECVLLLGKAFDRIPPDIQRLS